MWIRVTKEKQLNFQSLPTMCTTSTAIALKMKNVASKLLTKQAKHVDNDQVVTQAMSGKGLKAC